MIELLGSNRTLGLVLLLTLALFVSRQRVAIAATLQARQAPWRLLARVAYGATVALLLWGTLADNWRKLISAPLDVNERFASQRLVQQPVPTELRAVTLLLLVTSLVTLAPLFARYVGGYGYQLALVIAGLAAFFPLYALRQRLDVGLLTIDRFPALISLDMLATVIFVALAYIANVALLLLTFLGLLGLVALPVTALLDAFHQREPPPETTAASFYHTLHEGVVARRGLVPDRHVEDGPPRRVPGGPGHER